MFKRCPTLVQQDYENQMKPLHLASPRQAIALGVGLADAVTTSSRDHQVRIQFHWQRGESPNAGDLTETGNAVDTLSNSRLG